MYLFDLPSERKKRHFSPKFITPEYSTFLVFKSGIFYLSR